MAQGAEKQILKTQVDNAVRLSRTNTKREKRIKKDKADNKAGTKQIGFNSGKSEPNEEAQKRKYI